MIDVRYLYKFKKLEGFNEYNWNGNLVMVVLKRQLSFLMIYKY